MRSLDVNQHVNGITNEIVCLKLVRHHWLIQRDINIEWVPKHELIMLHQSERTRQFCIFTAHKNRDFVYINYSN